jgi:hypothetical protein
VDDYVRADSGKESDVTPAKSSRLIASMSDSQLLCPENSLHNSSTSYLYDV